MIDPEVHGDIEKIKDYVSAINFLLKCLHEKEVEVRIAYKDSTKDSPPMIDLWRATAHVDYLNRETE